MADEAQKRDAYYAEQAYRPTCPQCGMSVPGAGGVALQGQCMGCLSKNASPSGKAKGDPDGDGDTHRDGDDGDPNGADKKAQDDVDARRMGQKPGAKGNPNAKKATMDAAGMKKSGLPPAAERLAMYGQQDPKKGIGLRKSAQAGDEFLGEP